MSGSQGKPQNSIHRGRGATIRFVWVLKNQKVAKFSPKLLFPASPKPDSCTQIPINLVHWVPLTPKVFKRLVEVLKNLNLCAIFGPKCKAIHAFSFNNSNGFKI